MINNGAFNFKLEHLASLPCYMDIFIANQDR